MLRYFLSHVSFLASLVTSCSTHKTGGRRKYCRLFFSPSNLLSRSRCLVSSRDAFMMRVRAYQMLRLPSSGRRLVSFSLLMTRLLLTGCTIVHEACLPTSGENMMLNFPAEERRKKKSVFCYAGRLPLTHIRDASASSLPYHVS